MSSAKAGEKDQQVPVSSQSPKIDVVTELFAEVQAEHNLKAAVRYHPLFLSRALGFRKEKAG